MLMQQEQIDMLWREPGEVRGRGAWVLSWRRSYPAMGKANVGTGPREIMGVKVKSNHLLLGKQDGALFRDDGKETCNTPSCAGYRAVCVRRL